MEKIITLSNGLRLAHMYLPNRRSVSVGVFVRTGSRNETIENNGISHFIEHVCFKGTQKRTSMGIVEEIAEYGAGINAFTSKEMTAYYVTCVDIYADKVTEVLADLFINHTFPEEEIEKEKGVVLEEISMVQDDPEDLCQELCASALFGNQPLGRTILGTAENVKGFTVPQLHDYVASRYVAENIVISIAGNISEEDALALTNKYFGSIKSGRCDPASPKLENSYGFSYAIKDNAQSNLCIAFDGFPYGSKHEAALSVVNTVLGGGMCSLLFQRVREQLGLAYSVYTYPSAYYDSGAFYVYLGTNPKTLKQSIVATKEVIAKLKTKDISEDILRRGRQQLIGGYVLGQESTEALMRAMGKSVLFLDKTFDINEKLKAVEKVTKEDVSQVIDGLFGKCAVGYVGVEPDFNIKDLVDHE